MIISQDGRIKLHVPDADKEDKFAKKKQSSQFVAEEVISEKEMKLREKENIV